MIEFNRLLTIIAISGTLMVGLYIADTLTKHLFEKEEEANEQVRKL